MTLQAIISEIDRITIPSVSQAPAHRKRSILVHKRTGIQWNLSLENKDVNNVCSLVDGDRIEAIEHSASFDRLGPEYVEVLYLVRILDEMLSDPVSESLFHERTQILAFSKPGTIMLNTLHNRALSWVQNPQAYIDPEWLFATRRLHHHLLQEINFDVCMKQKLFSACWEAAKSTMKRGENDNNREKQISRRIKKSVRFVAHRNINQKSESPAKLESTAFDVEMAHSPFKRQPAAFNIMNAYRGALYSRREILQDLHRHVEQGQMTMTEMEEVLDVCEDIEADSYPERSQMSKASE